MLSQRVRDLEPPATLELNSLRLELQAKGRRVFNFGVGEPDFDTPEFIRAAAGRAIDEGWTRYTPVPGVPELRGAIAAAVAARRGAAVEAGEVIATSGAKQALSEALLVLLNLGDEVLLHAPYWVSYPDMVRLAGGVPVAVPTRREEGYRLRPELLEPRVTPRTTGIILNSPCNPTGAVFTAGEVEALVSFAAAHDLWILSDEIYEDFIFDGELSSPFSGEGRERTILVSGVSKSCAMTGWRIGWAVASREIIGGMSRLQGHTASNPCSISQAAAIAALEGRESASLAEMIEEFERRRGRALELLAGIPGLELHPPEGAFYIFLDLGRFLTAPGAPGSAAELCRELLDTRGVALVPGEAFGEPQGARLSYACSLGELEEGIAALDGYLKKRFALS